MGREAARSSLADALFTPVQQRVLGLLFGQPERRFQSAEIIRLARGGTGAVHRQLSRLEAAGLVSATRSGNQKHYQARRDSPLFGELHGLVTKTVGLVEPLRHALERHASAISAAFVYGSVAKGTDTAGSDIDLLVVSDRLRYPEAFEALQDAEEALARPVHPTVITVADWRAKRSRRDSFAARVAGQPKLFVIGSATTSAELENLVRITKAEARAAVSGRVRGPAGAWQRPGWRTRSDRISRSKSRTHWVWARRFGAGWRAVTRPRKRRRIRGRCRHGRALGSGPRCGGKGGPKPRFGVSSRRPRSEPEGRPVAADRSLNSGS